MLETCAACAHMRAYSDDDDAAKPEPMSDQHVVDTVAVIGDGSLSIHPSIHPRQHALSEEQSAIHLRELGRTAS